MTSTRLPTSLLDQACLEYSYSSPSAYAARSGRVPRTRAVHPTHLCSIGFFGWTKMESDADLEYTYSSPSAYALRSKQPARVITVVTRHDREASSQGTPGVRFYSMTVSHVPGRPSPVLTKGHLKFATHEPCNSPRDRNLDISPGTSRCRLELVIPERTLFLLARSVIFDLTTPFVLLREAANRKRSNMEVSLINAVGGVFGTATEAWSGGSKTNVDGASTIVARDFAPTCANPRFPDPPRIYGTRSPSTHAPTSTGTL
ncbi:hypothetical protein ONZ45_g2181 [Pleurotus djamor]|nr:hypothetical protein ONZ45_g2181 [Pleurotus djamor]